MSKTYLSYYAILIIVSLISILHTVFLGSVMLHQTSNFRQLQVQKEHLLAQKKSLKLSISQNLQIEDLQTELIAGNFQDIQVVDLLQNQTALAAK